MPKRARRMSLQEREAHLNTIKSLLEMIERANAMLARHQAVEPPDGLQVQQYQRLRQDYLGQLAILLAKFQVQVALPVAKA
ncbi:MAG: hypothetical protein MUC97_15565 [Bernardetiaceae bacterium]|jgi:hypothetical protein|nr:hypothetical protein [Bernardetiaceae bacterium]